MAILHFNRKILKLCLYSWKKYARHKMEKKLLQLEHEDKAKKMALFLKNAAEQMKKLNDEEEEKDEQDCRKKVNDSCFAMFCNV